MLQIWSAYRGGAMPDVFVRQDLLGLLGNALRPLSKLYELWCLASIAASLERLGIRWEDPFLGLPDSIEGSFPDGSTIALNYNVTPPRSEFIAQVRQTLSRGHDPRPDFLLHFRMGTVQRTLILDAKYKVRESIDGTDLQRLAWYGLTFTSSSDAKVRLGILHLDPSGNRETVSITRQDPHVTIHLIGLQPERGRSHLSDFLAEFVRA